MKSPIVIVIDKRELVEDLVKARMRREGIFAELASEPSAQPVLDFLPGPCPDLLQRHAGLPRSKNLSLPFRTCLLRTSLSVCLPATWAYPECALILAGEHEGITIAKARRGFFDRTECQQMLGPGHPDL